MHKNCHFRVIESQDLLLIVEKNDCDLYKLCLKMDDKYECFNKMDQKEYEKCKQLI
jgi:hypothetical protein